MQAHGADRLRTGKGGELVLFCPRDKGWTPRAPKTLTSAEYPGTAILWDEKYFEVVSATPSGTGIRYVLKPWRENHAIRITDMYDEASEAARVQAHQDDLRRHTQRGAANYLGIFTGNLPAPVQEKLASELGLLAPRLTIYSLLIPMTVIGFIVVAFAGSKIEHRPLHPGWLFLAGYLGFETMIRFTIAWMQNRPIGSAAGFLAYSLWYLVSPNKAAHVPPIAKRRTPKLVRELPHEQLAIEAVYVREPFLTLLSAQEQATLAERYGYDYRQMSSKVAIVILIGSMAGIVSSWMKLPAFSAFISLLVATGLAFEQILRLMAFGRGPAGSVLGVLVRPVVRKLF